MSDEIIDFHVNPAAQVKVPEEILSSIQRGIDCMAFNGLIGGPFRRAAGVSRAIGEDLAILIEMYSRNNPGHIEFRFVPEWTFGGEGALLSGTDTLVPHGLVSLGRLMSRPYCVSRTFYKNRAGSILRDVTSIRDCLPIKAISRIRRVIPFRSIVMQSILQHSVPSMQHCSPFSTS